MKHSLNKRTSYIHIIDPKSNSFSLFIVFAFVFLTLIFAIPSQILTFSSILATSSNNDNERGESDTNESTDKENDVIPSTSNENQQDQDVTTDEDADSSESNEASSDESSIPSEDNDVSLLTDSINTLVSVKPNPNLENSPGVLKVTMNVDCKSTNGLPNDQAVCDTFTKEPEFIQPKDYSLTLAVERDGTNYRSTFSGDSEDQTFTIKPGDFEISGVLHRDANDVVAKIGAHSQLDGVDLASSASGDCSLVNMPPGNVYGEVKVKGTILSLTDSTCTINVHVNYYNIELPKSSFGDMLQNQRMPDVVIQE